MLTSEAVMYWLETHRSGKYHIIIRVWGETIMPPSDKGGWIMLAWLVGCAITGDRECPES